MADGNYNYIYTKLVENENDILGIIAYSLYKRQKIEYVQSLKEKKGCDPSDGDLSQFHDVSNSQFQLQAYRNQADKLAQDFLTISLETRAEELEKYYNDQATSEIKSYKPNYWIGVSQGVLASVIFVMLLGLLVIFTWSLNQGPRQVIEQVFNISISDRVSSDDATTPAVSSPSEVPVRKDK
ncbi:hypothetical protein ACOI7N_00025 [Pseudomonas sp. P2758]|uniref:hypothetical protein n=1 Tax=Pseudomonas sp. P2758 TaxID=3409916 RepID=UPI003B5C0E90